MNFDINKDSRDLKALVSQYQADNFIGDVAELITLIEPPRMQIYPFQGFDSPFRQLTYLASLNLASDPNEVTKKDVSNNDEWKELVVQTIKVRAGYYEELLPDTGEDDEQFKHFYKIGMPVFNNYFDTGELNYEEQEIEKIEKIFYPFNNYIKQQTTLDVKDFTKIYNLIDQALYEKLNIPLRILRESNSASKYFDNQKQQKIRPSDWEYNGDDLKIIELVSYFKNRSSKFIFDKAVLERDFDKAKIEKFLELFSITRNNRTGYIYYTQPNLVLLQPLFKKSENEYLSICTKQILQAIYRKLHDLMSNSPQRETYFETRGKWLQDKTEQILRRYFGNEAHIYNEFKVNGKAHDILLLYKKNLALIIENKAHKEVQFSGVPDTINIYKQYFSRFKKSIQDGYDQSWRLKDLFYFEDDFEITDLKNNPITKIKANNYPNVFSIIVTLDKFRDPQINTSELVKLNEDDDFYPLSISIDDFEVLLLTLKKQRIGIGAFINFLKLRQLLQGRLVSNDELEVWGAFLNKNNRFTIPDDPNLSFKTFPEMTDIFDESYETGLGFENEKGFKEKKLGQLYMINSVKNRDRFNPK